MKDIALSGLRIARSHGPILFTAVRTALRITHEYFAFVGAAILAVIYVLPPEQAAAVDLLKLWHQVSFFAVSLLIVSTAIRLMFGRQP